MTTSARFESDEFAIQIMAKGSFVDIEGDKQYLIEATTMRLNHVALNAWLDSEMLNCRSCYETGEQGRKEWEAHKAEYAERRKIWKERLLQALDIDAKPEKVSITQSLSEVFTVVYIREID